MNLEQTARVLTKIQLGDNRVADQLILSEWHDTIGDLDFDDAISAVTMHRRESSEYLMPAHIIANVKRINVQRQGGRDWMGNRIYDPAAEVETAVTGDARPLNEAAMAKAWNDPEQFAREVAIYHEQLRNAAA